MNSLLRVIGEKLRIRFVVSILFLFLFVDMQAQKTRISGVVLGEDSIPVAGADITDKETNKSLGATNDDGRFSCTVKRNAVLVVSSMGYETKEVPVDGQIMLKIKLDTKSMELDEILVEAKILNKLLPDETDLIIEGNYVKYVVSFRVPKKLADSNVRLIHQPILHNITQNTIVCGRPIVIDGRNYGISQERMYRYDKSKDPLSPYLEVSYLTNKENRIMRRDSVYFDNQNDDFRLISFTVIEDYKKIIYKDSTIVASGTVKPLRFLEYNFKTADITDDKFIPKPEMQLHEDKGEIKLTFKIGKADLDPDNKQNSIEIERLNHQLKSIESDENSTLQSFSIAGLASPDGRFAVNQKLAVGRMIKAKDRILDSLNKETLNFLKVQSDSRVATWEEIALLMEKDSLPEAVEVRNIIKKFPSNQDKQGALISRLPYYKSLISNKYLPKLRRIEYNFSYSIFRYLTDDEIKALYRDDYKKLTRYEFYRLINLENGEETKSTLYKQALEVYPTFVYAANKLAVYNIEKGTPDIKILEPFIGKKVPNEVLINHSIALLADGKYAKADSVISLIPDSGNLEKLKAINNAFNGRYQAAFDILKDGGINEVVLLLAMKRNQEAYEKSKALPSANAKNEYVKAIAANRLDRFHEALISLMNAITLDPKLEEIAKIDGDVKDLLE